MSVMLRKRIQEIFVGYRPNAEQIPQLVFACQLPIQPTWLALTMFETALWPSAQWLSEVAPPCPAFPTLSGRALHISLNSKRRSDKRGCAGRLRSRLSAKALITWTPQASAHSPRALEKAATIPIRARQPRLNRQPLFAYEHRPPFGIKPSPDKNNLNSPPPKKNLPMRKALSEVQANTE
jgi:hypothetical protein